MTDTIQDMRHVKTVLAVHIGHDAGASVVREGKILSHILGERVSRLRHMFGIDRRTIETALKEAGIGVDDLDLVAVTATQQMPGLVYEDDYFRFSVNAAPVPQSLMGRLRKKFFPTKRAVGDLALTTDNPYWKNATSVMVNTIVPDTINESIEALFMSRRKSTDTALLETGSWRVYEALSPKFGIDSWLEPQECLLQATVLATTIDQGDFKSSVMRFHQPITVILGGRQISGVFVDHHMAHQCSSYYSSGAQNAIVLSHDGGTGLDSGFVSIAQDGRLYPLGAHGLELGQFYDFIAARLGLGEMGGAGKLMGLASYGKGALLEDASLPPAGGRMDWEAFRRASGEGKTEETLYAFMLRMYVNAAKRKGMDVSAVGDPNRVLEAAPSEIAHAVQKLIEESMLAFMRNMAPKDVDLKDYTLCLSGGVALNCPANSRLDQAGLFKNVYIEPHCDDGGLTIGAAYYCLAYLGEHAGFAVGDRSAYALLGLDNGKEQIRNALEKTAHQIVATQIDDWAQNAAQAVTENKVIALCFGRSETGPRALGARSIVANVTYAQNWERVNKIKNRETWRPFAPACRLEDLATYFEQGPRVSPFMLSTYQVKDAYK